MLYEEEGGEIEYGLIGRGSCMGDHKVFINLAISLNSNYISIFYKNFITKI